MRARILKPSFFTSDQLALASPWARLLFQGLWCVADRKGRLEERPLRLKAEIFPYDAVDCAELIDELAEAGVIVRYQVAGVRYIEIPGFERHQHPHPNEPASEIPPPPSAVEPEAEPNPTELVTSNEPSLHDTSPSAIGGSTRADRVSSDPDRVSSDRDSQSSTARARDPVKLHPPPPVVEGLIRIREELCGLPDVRWRDSDTLASISDGLTVEDVPRIRKEVEDAIAANPGRGGSRWRLVVTIAGRVSATRKQGHDPWADPRPSVGRDGPGRGGTYTGARGRPGVRAGDSRDAGPRDGPERDYRGIPLPDLSWVTAAGRKPESSAGENNPGAA